MSHETCLVTCFLRENSMFKLKKLLPFKSMLFRVNINQWPINQSISLWFFNFRVKREGIFHSFEADICVILSLMQVLDEWKMSMSSAIPKMLNKLSLVIQMYMMYRSVLWTLSSPLFHYFDLSKYLLVRISNCPNTCRTIDLLVRLSTCRTNDLSDYRAVGLTTWT